MNKDPRAIIEQGAVIAENVTIGPYTFIGKDVTIGEGTLIGSGVIVEGKVHIGSRCILGHHVVIGTPPQDLSYQGEETEIWIGDETIIREFATVHRATGEGNETRIGRKCYIMSYCHIAHNCRVGDEVTMANNASLAGYVEVNDMATISGFVGIHQFVRIGKLSMLGGLSKVVMDIPPFCLADGHPARLYGLNVVGLKRRGYSKEERDQIKKIYQILFERHGDLPELLESIQKDFTGEYVTEIINFFSKGRRGITRFIKEKRLNDVY